MEFNIKDLMEQAKRFESEMASTQSKLEEITATGSAGADMVVAAVNGVGKLLEVKISDDLFSSGDKKMLEDLIVAAVNNAIVHSQEEAKKEAGKIVSGFKGMPGFPFA